MTDTTTAPAASPEPEGQPCPDCGQVHPAIPEALKGMSPRQAHDLAVAALAQEVQTVIEAGQPGQYPGLEKAMDTIAYTAQGVIREMVMEKIRGQGRDIVNASAHKSQEMATARPEARVGGPYL